MERIYSKFDFPRILPTLPSSFPACTLPPHLPAATANYLLPSPAAGGPRPRRGCRSSPHSGPAGAPAHAAPAPRCLLCRHLAGHSAPPRAPRHFSGQAVGTEQSTRVPRSLWSGGTGRSAPGCVGGVCPGDGLSGERGAGLPRVGGRSGSASTASTRARGAAPVVSPRPLHAAGRSGGVTRPGPGYKAPAGRLPAPEASRRLRQKHRAEKQRKRGRGENNTKKERTSPNACSSVQPHAARPAVMLSHPAGTVLLVLAVGVLLHDGEPRAPARLGVPSVPALL